MEKYPKVLVGVTVYEDKDYIFMRNYEIVSNLSYPNYDFVIVDNSKSFNYARKLRRRGVRNVVHLKREKNSRLTLTKCQNYLRQRMIDGGYDYLMFIESDLLPPKNIVEFLMQFNKRVVGAMYRIGTQGYFTPCIFVKHRMNLSGMMGTRLVGVQMDAVDTKIPDRQGELEWINTGLRQCHGMGFGCTLFDAEIIKDTPFWCDERFSNKHSDVYFYLKMDRKQIPVFVWTNMEIEHHPSQWDDVDDM